MTQEEVTAVATRSGGLHASLGCLAIVLFACGRPIVIAEIETGDARIEPRIDAPATSDGATGNGLRGEYFANINLTGSPVLTRIDPQLKMVWVQISPGPGVPLIFSVRWQAELQAEVTGPHILELESDDGSRLWFDGALLIDQWKGAPNKGSATVTLSAGRRYALRAELYSLGGSGSIQLSWTRPGFASQVVPSNRFFVSP